MNNQSDMDKIYLYAKYLCEAKYQDLMKKREKVGLNHYNDAKDSIEYSNDKQEFYKNI